MTVEFKVGEWSYRAEKLDAFQQCDVAVLLLPVMTSLREVFIEVIKKAASRAEGEKLTLGDLLDLKIAESVTPFAQAMAAMPRDDRHFVLRTSLSAVKRIQEGGMLAPVVANGQITFPDIRDDMTVMLQLVWHVLRHNLENFSFAQLVGSK